MITSPLKILKLWNRVNDRFGPAEGDEKKKLSDKDKAAAKQNDKITKGLTVLKHVVQEGVKEPSQIKKFEATRDKVVLVMKKYCTSIKSAKLEGAQDMTKFRKNVKQLTVVVEGLSAKTVTTEEGEDDLGSLLDVDISKLDQAMEDPNFAAGDDNVSFDEAPDAAAPPAPPPAPPLPGKPGEKPAAPPTAAVKPTGVIARLNTLTPQYLQVIQGKSDELPRLKMLFTTITGLVKNKDMVQAGLVLDELEPLVRKALASQPGAVPAAPPLPGAAPSKAPPAAASKEATDFQARLKALMTQAVVVGKTQPEVAKSLKLLFSEAQTFDRKKDNVQASTLLNEAENLLKKAQGTPDAASAASEEPDAEAPKDLAAAQALWQQTYEVNVNKLRVLAKKVAASKHAQATKALIELNAVIKQVTKSPDSMKQVMNLERWLKEDDVVTDVCKLSFDVRKPLLKALAGLKPFVPA